MTHISDSWTKVLELTPYDVLSAFYYFSRCPAQSLYYIEVVLRLYIMVASFTQSDWTLIAVVLVSNNLVFIVIRFYIFFGRGRFLIFIGLKTMF